MGVKRLVANVCSAPPQVLVPAILTPPLALCTFTASIPRRFPMFAHAGEYVAAAGHIGVVILLLIAWHGLLRQKRWSRWALVILPGVIALGVPIGISRADEYLLRARIRFTAVCPGRWPRYASLAQPRC